MKIAGIDVHKKVLMVVVVDTSAPEEKPARRRFVTLPVAGIDKFLTCERHGLVAAHLDCLPELTGNGRPHDQRKDHHRAHPCYQGNVPNINPDYSRRFELCVVLRKCHHQLGHVDFNPEPDLHREWH